MEYSGLATKYPVNRPLTEEEKANRLNPKKKLDVSPHYNLSVIRINSTYLEIVDKFYAWKGMLALVSAAFVTVFGGGSVFLILDTLSEGSKSPGMWLFRLFVKVCGRQRCPECVTLT